MASSDSVSAEQGEPGRIVRARSKILEEVEMLTVLLLGGALAAE